MPAFELIKWYADVLDPGTGHLVICYDSTLRWQALALRFVNRLELKPPAAPRSSASFAQAASATLGSGGHTFDLRQRGLHGQWQQQAPAIREVLLDTPQGQVLWECFMPEAMARLRWGDKVLHGLGYVERLTLTLPPWQLPLHTLRWGRFVAAGHYVVWLRWDGFAPRHLIFHNGQRYEQQGHIGDEYIAFGAWQLRFAERHTLRTGTVGTTVFKRFGWFRRLVPARILHLNETKWLSAAHLSEAGTERSTGYAVHERVAWPM